MIKCPECKSEEVAFSITRRLTYKIDGVTNGELDLGELIDEDGLKYLERLTDLETLLIALDLYLPIDLD